ncbi:MAG: methyltransferase domain-containing protein [Chloroflexi bacterium]|nr:methyltransferase domain-containing protein [Chloroflexota bacterium]
MVRDENELAGNLRDLERLNRLPGGTHASLDAIGAFRLPSTDLLILDVGAGAGDMPIAFARRGWRTVALDTHPQVAAAARLATAHEPLVEVTEGNGLSLAYPDGAFAVSHCSLVLHHLDPDDAVVVLREMARVARHGVVINDVRRGLLPFVAIGVVVALLGTCRTTRVDGLTSVRRAYTLRELDDLLDQAGLEVAWRSNPFMPRVATAAVQRTGR